MKQFNVNDTVTIDGSRIREDGCLVVDARVARTGIQTYLGSEVGRPDLKTVTVYRPPEEVFDEKAMASFAHRPVTNDHPPEHVNAENWKKYAVGNTDGEVRQEGKFLRIPLIVSDANTIKDVQGGKKELSNGYSCVYDFTPGVEPETNEMYDAVQRNIRGNHVAVVGAGRAGSECRIGDGLVNNWGASPVTEANLKGNIMDNLQQKVVDGIPVSCTDAAAMTIDKLVNDRKVLQEKLDAATAKAKVDEEEKAKELASKDAEIDGLKAKVLDSAALDALVARRATLIDVATKLAPDVKTQGVSDSEIRKSVVIAKCGDAALVGREGAALDMYVEARFDGLVDDALKSKDQFGRAFQSNDSKPIQFANDDVFAKRQAAFDALVQYDRTGQDVKAN